MLLKVTDCQPSPPLRDYVQGYKLIESGDGVVNHLLPGTGLALAFRLKGDVSHINGSNINALPLSTVSGLRSAMREIKYGKEAKTLVVLFSAIGAARVFNQPLHSFYDQTLALEDVGMDVQELQDSLLSALGFRRQIQIIEAYLYKRIMSNPHDPLIAAAIKKINASRGVIRVKQLSDDLCLSQDAFEKRFRKAVGATAKQYAGIVRMHAIIKHKPDELAQVSCDLEFYDRAHFTKSFKQFTGKTPTDFFNGPSYW